MTVLVQAKNNTGSTITYSAFSLTITAGSTVTVPNSMLKAFSLDITVNLNIITGSVSLGDGTTLYATLTALDFLRTSISLLGSVPPLIPSAVAAGNVGITSSSVVSANTARKGLILVNTSVGIISLGIGATAVLYSGVTLYPGGSWTMDSLSFSSEAINAIASVASCNLAVQEFTA